MRRIKIMGLCLVAALALTVVASASAEVIPPELGRCVAKAGGKYGTNSCTKKATTKTEKYEWEPGPGSNAAFTSKGGVATLESVGKVKITCKAATNTGKYNGAFEDETTVHFTSCESVSAKVACQNTGGTVGEIVTNLLKSSNGEIGPKKIGVLLEPKSGENLAEFECGGSGTGAGALVFVHGSVIAPETVINKMEPSFKQAFKATKGIQKPTKFATGPEHVLVTTTFLSKTEKTEEQSGQTISSVTTNSSPLEIRDEIK